MKRVFAISWAGAAMVLLGSALPARADTQIPPQVQSAVDRGLEWLAKNQRENGSWGGDPRTGGAAAATTSFSVMAFMARGHVPGQGPYGEQINKGVDYIVSIQKSSGLIDTDEQQDAMYEHGISTVMLCEAYGMLDDARQQKVKAAIAKAVRLILKAQAVEKSSEHQGGWRYQPNSSDSDFSVTGWQLMALRGAANIGAAVPKSAIDAGVAYVLSRAHPGGGFMYSNGRLDSALTGTGIVALELLGQHNAKQSLAAGDYLMTAMPKGIDSMFYFYTVYYCSQAAWQLGGRYWESLNPVIQKSLLARQLPNGSWSVRDTIEQGAGPALGTSMAILALTVPYRYLPIYQR